MKKKIIYTITTVALVMGAFLVGKFTTKSATEIKVPDTYINTQSEDFGNNYIDLRKVESFKANVDGELILNVNGDEYELKTKMENASDFIPIFDIAGWYMDKNDYISFELGDITRQNDDENGVEYNKICNAIPHMTKMESNK